MRILVVEDEQDLCSILVKELKSEGYVVDFCYDGQSAYDYLTLEDYDGVIMDVMLPEMNGFTVLQKIRAEGVTVPVLFLTAKNQTTDIIQGLDLGADDYVGKPFVLEELLARVRVMVRKKYEVKENIYRCGELVVDCNEHSVKRGEDLIELSPKEYALLLYLIQNQNQVLTREQIEANIWDLDYNGYSNVVDVYIRYLRKKLDDAYSFKMIQTIRGVGYLLKGQED